MDSCRKKQRVPSHQKHKSHVKPRRLTSLKVTVGSRNSRGEISRLTGTGILTRPERNHYFSWHWLSAHGSEMDTVSSGTAIRSSYSLLPLMASLPLWLTYQEMMPTLPKGQPFSGDERRAPKNGRLYRLWNILITGKVLLPGYHQQTSAVANLLSAIAANSHFLPYCF